MPQKNALLLIDIQNDYFTNGLWPVENMDRVAAKANEVLTAARAAGELIVHVRHEAASTTAPFFLPGTVGAEIHESVAPLPAEKVVLKHRPNSFQGTDLHETLQASGVKQVTIIGAMTQMCIDATTRAARDLGYEVSLVAEACGAKSMQFGDIAVTAEQVQAAFMKPLEMSYATIL